MKIYKDNPKFNEIIEKMKEEHGYELIINAVGSYIFSKEDDYGFVVRIVIENHLDEEDDPDYYIYPECEHIDMGDINPYCITYKEMCLIKELVDIFKEE